MILNYSGHREELLTILQKPIHLGAILEKTGSQPGTHYKGWRENYVSSSTVSGDEDETCWDTPLPPERADGTLGKLAEPGKGWGFLPNPAPPDLPLRCLVREEGKILCCPFFSKFRLAGKENIGYGYFLSQAQLLPSCLSHFASWELNLATVRLGDPKNMTGQKCELHPTCS